MAHIFKHPSAHSKGIVVFTHQEVSHILSNPDIRRIIGNIEKNNFIGVHYGGFSFGSHYPPFCHFFMGRRSVVDIARRHPQTFEIPLGSAQFTSVDFCPNPAVHKYWDVICVSRNNVVKKLDVFFREIRKLYDNGYDYKILLVCPSRHEEEPRNHFLNITDVYYDMFSREERSRFTLLRLSPELEFKGMSKKQLSYFYQSSKVSTLLSDQEGSPGVIPEALLCGLPMVVYANQRGSGLDFLDETNSVQWLDYNEIYESLIHAVENYDKFNLNQTMLVMAFREDYNLKKLKNYFSNLYSKYGAFFDGELVNTDDLVSRLPAHYTGLPWANNRHYNGHMTTLDQFEIFYLTLIGESNAL
jgi:glycosyltransferase involved in cell wall biosynthesis